MGPERRQTGGQERLLIAEDSLTQAEQLRALLEDGGYIVEAAANGREALEAALREPPSLVISDVNMPEMDGYDFCRAFKAEAALKDIPFMLVTSLTAPSDVVHGLECGADNFITKPYEENTLLERVRYLLTNSALRGSSRVRSGVEIDLGGKVHFITAQRQQILDLLISTYAEAVRLSDEAVKRGEQLRESYEIMSVLQTSAEGLNRVRSEAEVVSEALARVRDLPFCRASWILLTDDDGMLERAGESGLTDAEAGALGSRTICACQRDAYLGKLGPVAQIEDCGRLRQFAAGGIATHAAVPLVGQQRNFGVLCAYPREPRPFAANELSILSGLGNQVSASLDRAYLYANLERQVEVRTQELRREIAVRQAAEASAIAATARLDRAQRIAQVGSLEINLATKQNFWSDELYRLLGLEPNATPPDTRWFETVIHPDDRANWLEIFNRNLAGITGEPIELRIQLPDGKERWLVRHCEPIRDQAGELNSLAISVQDITARKRADEELRESREHLALAQRVGGIGSAEVDLVSREEIWSEEHSRIFGVPHDPRPKKYEYFLSFLHPEDRGRVVDANERALRGEQVESIEFRIVRPDGVERHILAQRQIERDSAGNLTRLLITNQDVTERKQAEIRLRATDARMREILDNAADGIVSIDRDQRIVTFNAAAETIFGYRSDEAVGQPIGMLLPPEAAALHPARVDAFLAGPNLKRVMTGRGQLFGRRKDGTSFPVEVGISKSTTTGSVLGTAVIRDMTQRYNLEEQLRQSQKMEAVGNLTGGIAHDFNNILAVVIGNLDLLKLELPEDGEPGQLVDTAITACLKGSELTKSLLAFSRRQPLQPKRINITALLSDSTKMLSRAIGESVQVHLKLNDGLWDVLIDPSLLESALLNMMVNSRDAMPNGGHIVIESRNTALDDAYCAQNAEVTPGDYVVLEVSDTGTGMPPEVLRRVFEPFFTTKEKGKGTGLGLAMVFGFVKQSGGHIKIYSEVGHGTTIRVYLPRIAKDEAGADAAKAQAEAPIKSGNELILVVEDNPAVRKGVCKQLTSAGYRIEEAESAAEALGALERGLAPDAIFSDVIMPGGITGAELAREVRQRWPRIKVLLTSGFPEGLLENGNKLPSGVNLLSKPYRMDDLLRKLREVIDA